MRISVISNSYIWRQWRLLRLVSYNHTGYSSNSGNGKMGWMGSSGRMVCQKLFFGPIHSISCRIIFGLSLLISLTLSLTNIKLWKMSSSNSLLLRDRSYITLSLVGGRGSENADFWLFSVLKTRLKSITQKTVPSAVVYHYYAWGSKNPKNVIT